MQVKTWLQRLTDESNLWFNAVKAEDEGDFSNAVSYYIKDAAECIKQRSLVRAALSCSCAANCLAKMGAGSHARMLYSEAAGIYAENSEIAMSESIRESLWSLQEAFENFTLAGDDDNAKAVRSRYVALATRTNPFSDAEQAASSLDSRKSAIVKPATAADAGISEQLASEIDSFMRARKSAAKKKDNDNNSSFDPGYVMKSIDHSGGSRLHEKSIAS